MRRRSAVLIIVAAMASAVAAQADVVEPGFRPRTCPPGSWGGFPHGNGPCVARPCSDDGDCFGNACAPTALCIAGAEVVSECGTGDTCVRGRCERARRCTPQPRRDASTRPQASALSPPTSAASAPSPALPPPAAPPGAEAPSVRASRTSRGASRSCACRSSPRVGSSFGLGLFFGVLLLATRACRPRASKKGARISARDH